MIDCPEGIPEGVRRAAADFSGNIRDRLIQPPLMVGLWKRVLQRKINYDAVRALPHKYRCWDEVGLNDEDIAIAALFYISMHELNDISQYSSKRNKEWIDRYKWISQMCRGMQYVKFLGGVDEYIGELHPRRNAEVQDALTTASVFYHKLAEAFERSDRGVRWDHRDDVRNKLGKPASKEDKRDPNRLFDPSSSGAIKARISAFIEAADKVYEDRLTGPLAHIASAVLAKRIDVKFIENCRRSLDRHRGPQTKHPS